MRVHVVMNHPAEGPGSIARWAEEHSYPLTTGYAALDPFPDPAQLGLVCVMGGPMAADDHDANPWLVAEKQWLRTVLDFGVPVLGVCLGAQILAEVLGGRVVRNPATELGWFPIELTSTGRGSVLFGEWPSVAVVGQWHSDTYELPEGIENAATSQAAVNQAFDVDGRVAGIQFHLEWGEAAVRDMVEGFGEDFALGGPYVQTPELFLEQSALHSAQCASMLWKLLDALTGDTATT